MKLSAILPLLVAVAATTVAARETNAERFARGLPPLPPVRRGSYVDTAKRHEPSSPPHGGDGDGGDGGDDGGDHGDHGHCSTGPVQCCNSVTTTANPVVGIIADFVKCELPGPNVPIGLGCSPLSILGSGGAQCNGQTVCCENNNFNGVINIGCTTIIL